jgi:putative hydrolase of the HAD superfamily
MQEHALIFDLGNVVAFFDYMRACDRFGSHLDMTGEDFLRMIQDRGFQPLMNQFECGAIGPEDFARKVMASVGLNLSYAEFVIAWQDIFWLNESIAQLIELLSARGYKLLLGSNTNILHAAHFRRQFAPTLNQLDHLIVSYEVGAMKPDRRFYDACVAAAGVPAASCVFIDDLNENVDGARQAGLTGLHYVGTPALISDLRRLGLEVPAVQC